MKNLSTMILGVVIILVLVFYMISYQVSFNQMAVVTTFGKATNTVNLDGKGAGLHWKAPWPIQNVEMFDRRLAILEDRLEEQKTADEKVVVVSAFLTWQIDDPNAFMTSVRDVREAQKQLRTALRDSRDRLSQYRLDELTNVDPEKSDKGTALAAAEAAMQEKIQKTLTDKHYGMKVCSVGIKRLTFPESVTDTVFSQQRTTRQKLAQRARSEGEAIANQINASAESDKRRILAFAERRAGLIKAEGDAEAAKYYDVFKQDEAFASFLRKVEALKETLKNNTTFLLDTQVQPFDLLAPATQPQPTSAQR